MLETLRESFVSWDAFLGKNTPKAILATVMLVLLWVLGRIVKKITFNALRKLTDENDTLATFISTGLYLIFVVTGVFIFLEILDLEGFLTRLLAGAGIVGIVAGFALKDIASNAFSGLLIKSRIPFKQGDWIEFQGTFGIVQEISLMTTEIRNVYGQKVFLPNQLVYSTPFMNYSSFGERMIVLTSGVSYGDDLDHVERVALDEAKKMTGLNPGKEIDFFFIGIGDSSYDFELRFWIKFTDQRDYLSKLSKAIMRIKKRFEEEDISLAYNVTTLDFGVKGGVNLFDKNVKVSKENQ